MLVLLGILIYLYVNLVSGYDLDLNAIVLFGYDLIVISIAVLVMVRSFEENSCSITLLRYFSEAKLMTNQTSMSVLC